jgi:N-acetyl-gamma-glutamyl-phosphate reductase
MIRVGIVGGTGYTGVELLRLLAGHPEVALTIITSRSEAGRDVADLFPNLRGHLDIRFTQPDLDRLCECETVFFATPNGTAMTMVPQLIDAGVQVIDLAADFRLKDPEVWEQWYGTAHACPDYLEQAVYGLPEINRDAIRAAQLVANPGCYPTAVQLGFLPLIEAQVVDIDGLIADAKSAVSGAGRKAATATLLCEAGENFTAYAVPGHRHLPEIRQGLESAAGGPVGLTFVPHLTPMIRGIHATLYAGLRDPGRDLQALYEARYNNEYFVDILPAGSHPETRSVRGSNHCRIAIHQPQQGGVAVVLAVIDNLVKGAAGQAVQNMNIMQGFDEQLGLTGIALIP